MGNKLTFKNPPVCFSCSKLIGDKKFIAISGVGQTNRIDFFNPQPEKGAWYKIHSCYYHASCFKYIAGEKFVEDVLNPQITEEDFAVMNKLAGIENNE